MATPGGGIVEFELTPDVWTDVTPDVTGDVKVSIGIRSGNGPLDRVAGTGTAQFTMNNSVGNSGGLTGYYSPNHVNVRSGFDYGTSVRILFAWVLPDQTLGLETGGGDTLLLETGDSLLLNSTPNLVFYGRLQEIAPTPGLAALDTACRAVDWMEDLATFKVRDVPPQASKRPDELLTAVINAMPTAAQPVAQNLDVGKDTYPIALHDLGDGTSGRTVAQRLMRSELGYFVVLGDGTARFFNRHYRSTVASLFTFNDTMHGLDVPSTLEKVFNRILVNIHPTREDTAATTVLWSLPVTPITIQPSIPAGQSITFTGTYFDPNNEDKLIGGSEQVTTLVADTDFKMASTQGTGNDLNGDASIVVSEFATTMQMVVSNSGTTDGFMTLLQLRGKGIYDIAPMSFESTSVQNYGERSIVIDMPYQDDPNVGQGTADYLQEIYGTISQQITSLSFLANHSDALMTQAHERIIGDKITVTETVTGLTDVEAFINGIEFTFSPGRIVRCTWSLGLAEEGNFWFLGDAVAGLLGETTVLGWV